MRKIEQTKTGAMDRPEKDVVISRVWCSPSGGAVHSEQGVTASH